MSINQIKVEYDGGDIDMALDKEITEFFESKGFRWTGQGMNLMSNVRGIGFEEVLESEEVPA